MSTALPQPVFLLETPRLRLRDFAPALDASTFFDLNLDPAVTRYTGDGPFASADIVEAFLTERLACYAREGMGRWVVESQATGEILGWCGLRQPDTPADGPDVDLGYRFFQRHWGQGYATEASRACLAHGFGALALPRIIVRIDPANAASLGVARKLGFRPRPGLVSCGTIEAQVLELTAVEWRAAQGVG